MKKIVDLFFTMLKIGLFTFGGGYAMISFFQEEFVEKKKWLDKEEFMNLVTIAESTPGPIAINSSTYIGYKVAKIPGAIFATIGMCIPSFVIIYIISIFFDQFLEIKIINNAFKGIKVCVIYLVLMAGIKMLKAVKLNIYNIFIIGTTFIFITIFTLFAINFSSVYFLLISGVLGVIGYLLGRIKKKEKEDCK